MNETEDENCIMVYHVLTGESRTMLAYKPILLTLAILIIISNSVVIYGLWKTNTHFKIPHKLYIFQCIVGTTDAIILMSAQSSLLYRQHLSKCTGDSVPLFGTVLQANMETITLAMIAVVRYQAIKMRHISGQKLVAAIIATYTYCCTIAAMVVWSTYKKSIIIIIKILFTVDE